ncbi:exported hypothetical protein [uncultured delta proteobacterium]|uniref:Uncharacterized protein n=1 Tax=uncultured delta proteobacterium TaxID=34034 RepID=A0A212KBP4_9DELT|nr:exported hypothetical protein [uncultured delta proteobacterium]
MKKKTAIFVLVILAAAAGCYWLWQARGRISSIEAVVEGRLAPVSATVSGTVKEVYVKAGETVAQGQPLLALDASGMERQLARERAHLAELAAQLPPALLVPSPMGAARVAPGKPLAALRNEEEEARRQVEIAAHTYAAANVAFARADAGASPEYAKPDPKRQAALITRDEAAISLKKARDAYEKASYARAQREMQDKLERLNGPVSAALAARVAEYQLQISRIRLAEQDIAATVLTAPENGTLILMTARPGDTLTPGDTPAAIAPEEKGEVWVIASFAKDDATGLPGWLAEGLACEVTLDGATATAKGTLARVLPELETEKTVAVRVILDQDGLPAAFSPGKAVTVSVLTGRANPLDTLLGKARAITAKN